MVKTENLEFIGKNGKTKKKESFGSSLVAQRVKDPVLSLPWLRSPLWCGFDPWAENCHVL